MAMVSVVMKLHISRSEAQANWAGLKIGSHLALMLHLPNEPGK